MEALGVGLGIALSLFAAVLAVLAWAAWRRFREGRFFLVGGAFLLISGMAAVAAIADLDLVRAEWFDEAFALEPVPLALLLVAILLIYGAMGGRRRSLDGFHDART